MKTFDQIRKRLVSKDFSEIGVKSVAELEEKAAKEYAKQWIDKASTVARMYLGLNAQNAIEDLKSKIDQQ